MFDLVGKFVQVIDEIKSRVDAADHNSEQATLLFARIQAIQNSLQPILDQPHERYQDSLALLVEDMIAVRTIIDKYPSNDKYKYSLRKLYGSKADAKKIEELTRRMYQTVGAMNLNLNAGMQDQLKGLFGSSRRLEAVISDMKAVLQNQAMMQDSQSHLDGLVHSIVEMINTQGSDIQAIHEALSGVGTDLKAMNTTIPELVNNVIVGVQTLNDRLNAQEWEPGEVIEVEGTYIDFIAFEGEMPDYLARDDASKAFMKEMAGLGIEAEKDFVQSGLQHSKPLNRKIRIHKDARYVNREWVKFRLVESASLAEAMTKQGLYQHQPRPDKSRPETGNEADRAPVQIQAVPEQDTGTHQLVAEKVTGSEHELNEQHEQIVTDREMSGVTNTDTDQEYAVPKQ